MAKLTAAEVLYMADGALKRCDRCVFWHSHANRCALIDPKTPVQAAQVCGLYVNGQPMTAENAVQYSNLPASAVGLGRGNTACGNCEYGHHDTCGHPDLDGFLIDHKGGCCNAWEGRKQEADFDPVKHPRGEKGRFTAGSPEVQQAVANTPGAKLHPDGSIEMDVERFQDPEQSGAPSVRTGVFFLTEHKSPWGKFYKEKKDKTVSRPDGGAVVIGQKDLGYGGSERVAGHTTVHNPIIVKASTGGRGPELAFDQVKGKGAYEEMRSDALSVGRGLYPSEGIAPDKTKQAETFLKVHGGDPNLAGEIVKNSKGGNLLPYALQEHVVAHALRNAGYDSVISFSKQKGAPRLAELFDLRKMNYPKSGVKVEAAKPKTVFAVVLLDDDLAEAEFDPAEHPRDDDGKFEGAGGPHHVYHVTRDDLAEKIETEGLKRGGKWRNRAPSVYYATSLGKARKYADILPTVMGYGGIGSPNHYAVVEFKEPKDGKWDKYDTAYGTVPEAFRVTHDIPASDIIAVHHYDRDSSDDEYAHTVKSIHKESLREVDPEEFESPTAAAERAARIASGDISQEDAESAAIDAAQEAANKVRDWVNVRLDKGSRAVATLFKKNRDGLLGKIRQIYDNFLGDDQTLVNARKVGALDTINRVVNDHANRLADEVGNTSVRLIHDMVDQHPTIVNRFYSPVLGEDIDIPTPKPYQTVLGELTTSVVGGGTYFDRLLHINQGMKDQIFHATRQSLIAGSGFEPLKNSIHRIFGVDDLPEPKTNAYGSINTYENEARRQWNALMDETGKRSGQKSVWFSMIPDPDTTPGCAARHGVLIEDLDAPPPRHGNCRCEVLVVDADWDLDAMQEEAAAYLKTQGYTIDSALAEESQARKVYAHALREAIWVEECIEAGFDPEEHPRDEKGEFTASPGAHGNDPNGWINASGELLQNNGRTHVEHAHDLGFNATDLLDDSYIRVTTTRPFFGSSRPSFGLHLRAANQKALDNAKEFVRNHEGAKAFTFDIADGEHGRSFAAATADEALKYLDGKIKGKRGDLNVVPPTKRLGKATEADFDPAEHPRDDAGKFADKGGGWPINKVTSGDGPRTVSEFEAKSGAAGKWAEGSGGEDSDPDNEKFKDKNAGYWGSSHTGSSAITGAAAKAMGLEGYRDLDPDGKRYDSVRLAGKMLQGVYDSKGSREALYHGFENTEKIDWKVGDTLTLPLLASSGAIGDSQGYGVRSHAESQSGEATIFAFPKGTPMLGYQKWNKTDAKDFGHVWSEAIIAGKFKVVGFGEYEDHGWQFRSLGPHPLGPDGPYLDNKQGAAHVVSKVVKLEPVEKFNPSTKEWTKV